MPMQTVTKVAWPSCADEPRSDDALRDRRARASVPGTRHAPLRDCSSPGLPGGGVPGGSAFRDTEWGHVMIIPAPAEVKWPASPRAGGLPYIDTTTVISTNFQYHLVSEHLCSTHWSRSFCERHGHGMYPILRSLETE